MLSLSVIGAGNWGKNLVRNFAALQDVEIKYICDLSEKVREGMARLYPGATATDDMSKAIGDDGVQVVVVAVDAPRHFEIAKQALLAGKHTYVEKPLTLCSADSEELKNIAEDKGLKLMVGHLLEYHPAVNYMKQMIEDGQVGKPLYLYFQRVNLGIVRQAENAWWSLAPHDVSVACYLFDAEPAAHADRDVGLGCRIYTNGTGVPPRELLEAAISRDGSESFNKL